MKVLVMSSDKLKTLQNVLTKSILKSWKQPAIGGKD